MFDKQPGSPEGSPALSLSGDFSLIYMSGLFGAPEFHEHLHVVTHG
jgi:hypothetical protein